MKKFAIIPMDLAGIALAGREWRVLLVLLAHAGPKGSCRPTANDIAQITGIDPDNVKKVIRGLRRKGLVIRHDGRVDRTFSTGGIRWSHQEVASYCNGFSLPN